MPFCLPKHIVNDFLQALKSGRINPETMMGMASEERRAFLAEIVGEDNAVRVNTLFETKMLLKDQQQGMITWAKNVAGISPKTRDDIIARVSKMDKILTSESEDAFLKDLAAQKLGVTVTMEEAANISSLAKIATEKKEVMKKSERREALGRATDAEMDYGRAGMAFRNYIRSLKLEAGKLTLAEVKADPIGVFKKELLKAAGIAKSLKATLDLSALFRQGWKVLMSHPAIWLKQAEGAFEDAYKTFGGKAVMDEINASIISHPKYDDMIKDKLAVTVIEEEFPESEVLEKVPYFGTLHKAAEVAFTGFMYKNRVDLYDYYTDLAAKTGATKTTGLGIGELANSLGSRGRLGRLEPVADVVNVVFFSMRNLKANFDVLTAHLFATNKPSMFVRKQAAINLVKVISGTAAVLAMAAAMGGDVEDDPTSADLGKIKVGNTRFDVTGGMASIAVLASRLIMGVMKSSATVKVTKIRGEKYTPITGEDLVYDFFANKYSPAFQVVRSLLRGRTFKGEKPTIANTFRDLTVPISVETMFEAWKDPKSADLLLITIAEFLGIGTQTYESKELPRGR